MAKSRSRNKIKESDKCTCLSSSCLEVKGLVVSVAGFGLLAFAFGYTNIFVASVITGVALSFYGLSTIIHALNICPVCHR